MLTASQEEAYKLIKEWISSKGKLFRLGGPAGSGKSYLIGLIADVVGLENCLLMTPTGKAANNLQKAGLEAHTIHSMIYHVQGEDDYDDAQEDEEDEWEDTPVQPSEWEGSEPAFVLKDSDTYKNVALFIIDEGSMVGGRLLKDILSFNVPTLLVGDPNQLAPVNDSSVYLTCDFYLKEIVRQAKDSPIIWLSQRALQGNIGVGVYGTCMVRLGTPTDAELAYADTVLTDTNARRKELNQHIRYLRFGEDPGDWVVRGDKLICRTNSPKYSSSSGFMLTNGTQGMVSHIKHKNRIKAELQLDCPDLGIYDFICTPYPLKFPPKKRPPTVELGYALTVHLSQGSEWPNVIYDISSHLNRRALYTAITRAKESLLITL